MGLMTLLIFLILLVLRVPLAVGMALSSLVYVIAKEIPMQVLAHKMGYAANSFPLLAVPLFVLAGNLMNTSGITDRIFRFARTLLGHFRGGLAYVNIVASLIFSGMSGAALADVGGLGNVEIKAMTDAGYSRDVACAVTAASATIGPIFPPSIPLIIYGAAAEVSGVHLLLGGVVPGLLLTVALMALVFVLAKGDGYPRDLRCTSLGEIARAFLHALPALLTPALLIAGFIGGWFSPTEGAAIAVVYATLIGAVVYRELDLQRIFRACRDTLVTTGSIMFVVAAASFFSWVLTMEGIPQAVANLLLGISKERWALLLLANVFLLIVGMFMESTAAILVVTPMLVPVLTRVGVDPIHFGVVMVLNLMIGLLTPPVGMSLYMVSAVGGISVERVVRAVAVYFIPLLAVLLLVTYVPQVVLFLPKFIM
ncbi:MAG: TRAP transporter large permease [Syntrophothermus sp.]|nr:TRAP transporter large permease [Syntrophothermus sp.]